jgi:ribosome-associated heat shock protein Hsp15
LENNSVDRIRLDKWLWAARFFKTRSLAAHACELGRVECHGQKAKPSREVHAGDRLHIRNESGDFRVEVTQLSAMRGPAAVAQTLYFETEADRELRLKAAQERKATGRPNLLDQGKPSKRDRREWNRLRNRI